MRQPLKQILLSFLALVLGASFLEAFQAPPQGVSFTDGTKIVGPWDKLQNKPVINNNLYDDHIMGGVLADLDGDGYPDLVLPGDRAAVEPEIQNKGGINVVPNRRIPGGGPMDRFFNWSLKKTFLLGTEAQGILALDYDNDGDLDLLVICQGTPKGMGIVAKLDDMKNPPADPLTNRLLNNDGFGNFTEVPIGTTDPDFDGDPNTPGTAIDGHGLAYTESPDAIKQDPNNNNQWVVEPGKTFKPPSSACAAAADVNLDGLIDIYIAQHHRDGSLKLTGMMDALYLNGGLGTNGNWIFWDVTYDRTEYQAFAGDGGSPYPGINWDEYIPVFGYQGEDLFRLPANHPKHKEYKPYLVPRSNPFFRFSSSIAAYFMDLNNDGWPDLVVANKAWIKKSLLANGALPSYRTVLNNSMVYINRGNDPSGKWLGFWNRSWDLFFQQDPDNKVFMKMGAPMGMAIGDYNRDRWMDFYITDASLRDTEITDAFPNLDPNKEIHMNNVLFTNTTGTGDLSFSSSGQEFVHVDAMVTTDPQDVNLHGNGIMDWIFSWGATFRDFDNDGDLDAYVCTKRGEDAAGTTNEPDKYTIDPLHEYTMQTPPGQEEAWDRIFENQLVQDPAAADADKFHDLNPGPYTPTLEAGTPIRDLESRNPIPGDPNLDGNMDLLVLPGTAHPQSTQFFQNNSAAAASNAKIGILLQNPGLCSMTTYFGVGARIRVKADLDGNGALDDGVQWGQVLVGEGNGATSTSPRIHFGLGKQDSQGGSPQVKVQVAWPCGHVDFQNFDVNAGEYVQVTIQPGFHDHLPLNFQPASFTPPDTSGSPFLADGMAPLQATAFFGDPVYHVELSARHAGLTAGPFFPVSMDHKKGSAGGFKLSLVPLLFPSDHDSMGLPLDETRYDLRVLAEGPFGNARWLDSIGQSSLQLVIKPELVEETDSGWKKADGTTHADTENGALKILAGEAVQREYLFPGWTDFVDYDLVLRLKSDAAGGSLMVSAPQMNSFEATIPDPMDPMAPQITTSFQDFPVIATAPPAAEFKTMIFLTNTGNTVIFVDWVKRARHSNPLE